MSPGRSPARLMTAPWPGRMPVLGAVSAVVNPLARHDSRRQSSASISSAAWSHGVDAGRSCRPARRRAARRTAGRSGASAGRLSGWCRPGRRQTEVRARVDQAGIDRQSRAVDDPRVGRHRNARADGDDEAVDDDHGPFVESRPRHRHDAGVPDGEAPRGLRSPRNRGEAAHTQAGGGKRGRRDASSAARASTTSNACRGARR